MTDVANEKDGRLAADRTASVDGIPELNGKPAELADVAALALLNYGHFTSMQISDRSARGLNLHLARLESATRELFGSTLDITKVRGYMRSALGSRTGECSLRVSVFSREFRRDRPSRPVTPDVLTTISAPRSRASTPLRIKCFHHERALPHIKHVGTFPLFHFRRLAEIDGFDDALFVDANGTISEASVWNIGFFDGEGIVWPNAPALHGVSMQLLQNGLRERRMETTSRSISRADIAGFRGAFLTHSSQAVRAVAAIDDVKLAIDAELTALLEACYASNPVQEI